VLTTSAITKVLTLAAVAEVPLRLHRRVRGAAP